MHSLLLIAGVLGAWSIVKAASPLTSHPSREVRMISSFMLLSLIPASALTVAITTLSMLLADGDCFARSATWDQVVCLVLSSGVIAYVGLTVTRGIERRRSLGQLVGGLREATHPSVLEALSRLAGDRPVVKIAPLDRPVAFVSGWRRTVVVISEWLLANLDMAELEAVIAHELAHVRRQDAVLAGLSAWCARFAPLSELRRIQAGLLADLEDAADALAVNQTGRPLALASALAKFWQFGAGPDLALSGTVQFGGSRSIHRRIVKLMAPSPLLGLGGERRDFRRSLLAIGLAWGLAILVLGVGPGWAMVQDHLLHCQILLAS